jgi:hypothetical protein
VRDQLINRIISLAPLYQLGGPDPVSADMYIENLDSFVQQAEDLYRGDPLKTRYVMKYRHCDGKLVLKVTDDTTVRCCASISRNAAQGSIV